MYLGALVGHVVDGRPQALRGHGRRLRLVLRRAGRQQLAHGDLHALLRRAHVLRAELNSGRAHRCVEGMGGEADDE